MYVVAGANVAQRASLSVPCQPLLLSQLLPEGTTASVEKCLSSSPSPAALSAKPWPPPFWPDDEKSSTIKLLLERRITTGSANVRPSGSIVITSLNCPAGQPMLVASEGVSVTSVPAALAGKVKLTTLPPGSV